MNIFAHKECPYEHIPDELTDPYKELKKNLPSPGKLLRRIKERKKEQEKTASTGEQEKPAKK
jgi:hypothetical protein